MVSSLLKPLARRLSNSTVAWSMAFNFLRLALGVLLLPLLLRLLSKPDLGMYYLFLYLSAIVIVLDLGFSPTIGRFVNYAMGGATRLAAQGVAEEQASGSPNYPLLWELLVTSRVFYRLLALATLVLLGIGGSCVVWLKVGETSSPAWTWLAWGVCVAAVAAETYFISWNSFLRNVNQVLAATQIAMFVYGLRLALACVLLWYGAGLLSLPAASLATSFLLGSLSRRACIKALSACPAPPAVDWRAHFRTIWPNCWRLGLYFAGSYLSTNAGGVICSSFLGLAANSKYGLSLQMVNIITGLAAVWTMVKWPLVGQYVARNDLESLRRTLFPRIWLQVLTFVSLAVAGIFLGPPVIRFLGKDKEMLSPLWLALLALNGLLEGHCSAWNTLISLWNRLPMLWPSLATNAAALLVNVALVLLPGAHPGWLALGPLCAGLAFNYWFWPGYGARTLGLSWFRFVRYGFSGSAAGKAGAI